MNSTRRGTALRRLLDLCDDLQRIRSRLNEPELAREQRARLRRQERSKRDRLARDLANYRFHGPLGQLLRESQLELVHFQILATLLQRHLRSDEAAIEGRRLLASVFDDAFEVLWGMELLDENGALRASGLIVLDDDEDVTEDVLEARFRISEDALTAFRDEVAGLVVEDHHTRTEPYAGNHELLVDLRILHNLYKHRSERVFQQDRWDRIRVGTAEPARQWTRRIQNFRRRIDLRLAATPRGEELPAVRFFRDHDLTDAEQIVVVHLLFKELYEGNAYADAAELLRLVSADEVELVRSRRLLLAKASLLRHDIVRMETMLEGRELTGEVYLADWAVNYLFGATPADGSIDPDARLDWHLYLKNLEDTGTFFRDLEAN